MSFPSAALTGRTPDIICRPAMSSHKVIVGQWSANAIADVHVADARQPRSLRLTEPDPVICALRQAELRNSATPQSPAGYWGNVPRYQQL